MKLTKKSILVLHGAGMNMRGLVDIEKFGKESLEDYENKIREYASQLDVSVTFYHSNLEGEMANKLWSVIQDKSSFDGIIINPGSLFL